MFSLCSRRYQRTFPIRLDSFLFSRQYFIISYFLNHVLIICTSYKRALGTSQEWIRWWPFLDLLTCLEFFKFYLFIWIYMQSNICFKFQVSTSLKKGAICHCFSQLNWNLLLILWVLSFHMNLHVRSNVWQPITDDLKYYSFRIAGVHRKH